jgi:hypothetical protein
VRIAEGDCKYSIKTENHEIIQEKDRTIQDTHNKIKVLTKEWNIDDMAIFRQFGRLWTMTWIQMTVFAETHHYHSSERDKG